MKKIYLTSALFTLSNLVFGQMNSATQNFKHFQLENISNEITHPTVTNNNRAQGDIIHSDDFSDVNNWTTPADANGYKWEIGSTFGPSQYNIIGSMTSTTASNGYAGFDGITSLIDHTVSAQNAVLELNQVIDCGSISGVILEFEQRYGAFNAEETVVEVSNDGGTLWTEFLINADAITNDPAVQSTITLNISSVAGNSSTVKVRFRWRELGADPAYGSGYAWQIDDLKLLEAWDYESNLINSYSRMGVGVTYSAGLEYHFIPTSQIAPIQYSGKIINNGATIQVGSKITVDVVSGGANVYSKSSAVIDIALLATDSFAVTPFFTPSGVGVYDVTITASQTNTENNDADNVSTHSFEITESTFGVDNGIEAGGISNVSNNDGNEFAIGNVMNVFTDGKIGALDIKLTSKAENVGKEMFGAIHLLNAAGDGYDQIAQTNNYTIESSDNGNFVKLFFPDVVEVTAGQEILIVTGSTTGEIEFASAQGLPAQTVLGFAAGALFNLTGGSAIMVRADMVDYTSVEESEISNISVSQNVPNPFNGQTVISYNLNESSNVSLKVMDVTGKIISTINEGTLAAGTHNITVDGSVLAAGTYFYTLTAGTFQVTKRMVVSK